MLLLHGSSPFCKRLPCSDILSLIEFFQALSLLFNLDSFLFFHVFDDLGINLLQELIGLSQYLFDVCVCESFARCSLSAGLPVLIA
jgi:hypothetical protein